jgi:hypothetical protein
MDNNDWSEEELSPIKDIIITDITKTNSVLGASIVIWDDTKYEIDFKDIDGERWC